jgi:sugar lactone lactonase YvrE
MKPDFRLLFIFCGLIAFVSSSAQENAGKLTFPVEPILFVDEPFNGCEGISFTGEGRLFATCNRALWEIGLDKSARQVTELFSNLGTAAIGERDILVADFGPTNAFRNERNSDGIIWRVTPEGEKQEISTGIGDPNFIVVLEDGSYLVSDDATADIYLVGEDGVPMLFSTAVNHPNGLALSADGSTLYVAQIFSSIRPVVADDAIWAIQLSDGKPVRGAKLVVRAGPNAAVDGLAMDIEGRVYIAANGAGQLWRYDPASEEMLLLASGMFGIASLAFGEGDFDHQSIYASATNAGGRGGKIWRIPVGTTGARLYR